LLCILSPDRLYEHLQESEALRLAVEEQMQSEVAILVSKHSLANEEMTKLAQLTGELMGHQNARQKVIIQHALLYISAVYLTSH
jgi:hypothetical protein